MPDQLAQRLLAILDDALGTLQLHPSDDFFDHGINSLTIVELQLSVENALQLQVPTSTLMLNSSIEGWLKVYGEAASSTC